MRQWIRSLLLLLLVSCMVLMPVAANAGGYTPLVCDDSNGTVTSGTLYDADKINDPSNNTGLCLYYNQLLIQHVFSVVICDFVGLLNTIMDNMYCAMNHYLVNTILVLLELYITIYGAQILMGAAQFSTRDGLVRLLKLSFIYVAAVNSSWGINFIFNFFMAVITTTSSEVIGVLANALNGTDLIANVLPSDSVCGGTESPNPNPFVGLDKTQVISIYGFMDYLVCHALLGPASTANASVQALFLSLAATMTPAYLMFQWWIVTTVKTLVMTLIAFLKSLAAIAFLVSLAPLFLGFYLFQSTAFVFENWIRYLISFSVQICIIFAIIVMWVLCLYQFIGFFNSLSQMIFPYVPYYQVGAVYKITDAWGICSPTYGTDAFGAPTAACGNGANGAFDANPPYCSGTPPTVTCNAANNPQWQQDNQDLILPSQIINQGEFIYYVFFHLITLLLVSYAFSQMLMRADRLAKALAGPSSAPSIAPGWGQSLGSVNNFQPSGVGGRSTDAGKSSQKMAADIHAMLQRR